MQRQESLKLESRVYGFPQIPARVEGLHSTYWLSEPQSRRSTTSCAKIRVKSVKDGKASWLTTRA